MFNVINLLFLVLLVNSAFAQSVEQGNAFNKFMNAEDGVNLLSGTAAFKKNLATISSGLASYDVELSYSSNVEEIVRNKNDVALSSWVGLGWTLGHAKIVSDNEGSMYLGDDSYYLQTSSGLKYKIVKDGDGKWWDDEENSIKWWLEGLPYWLVKPIVKKVEFKKDGAVKTYPIVIGWEIINDVGVKFIYGDMEYKEGKSRGANIYENPSEYTPKRNATEYTIANPYSFGFVGVYENGDAILYPNAWNLAKMEDYNGNYLIFSYDQYEEKVKRVVWSGNKPYQTDVGYTKECYLKTISSSQGEKIEFVTKPKDINREFIDNTGEPENDASSEPDGYIDPMERRFLSEIKLYGQDGEVLRYIDFCYEQLDVKINGTYNQDYAKRLLSSIVEVSGGKKEDEYESANSLYAKKHPGEEIQKESFRYIKKDIDEKGKPLPLGAIDSIIGPNCGVVKYEYEEQALVNLDPVTGLHKETVDLKNVALGRLEDGTDYAVGIDDETKKAVVLFKIQNVWTFQQNLVDGTDGEFFIGDKNWFVFRCGNAQSTYYPFVWNGEFWEQKRSFVDFGNHDKAIVGPGYLLTAHIANNKIDLRIPWTIWDKNGTDDFWSTTIENVDDGVFTSGDRTKYVNLYAGKNHFGVSYKKEWKASKDGMMKIYSFDSNSDKKPQSTLTLTRLDQDNQFVFFDDNIILELKQGGLFDDYEAYAYYWRDNNTDLKTCDHIKLVEDNCCDGNWCFYYVSYLPGVQKFADFQAVGSDYFVVRHNDNDNMSLFEYDGLKWSTVYRNENMVHDQDFDWWEEAEWDATPGYNFFVARRPRIRKRFLRNNEIKPYREYQLIERIDGEWKAGDIVSSGNVKIVYAGSDWYFVNDGQKGYVRNGFDWNVEDYAKNLAGGSSDFLKKDSKDYSYLNAEYFVEKSTTPLLISYGHELKSKGVTHLYYKKNDSFKSNIKGFFVSKKYIKDPVVDKVVSYEYSYGKITYSFLTKSSMVSSYMIKLPDGAGVVERYLCDESKALGEICQENYYEHPMEYYVYPSSRKPVKSVVREYERHREKNWPKHIYLDRIVKQKTVVNNLSKEESYTYADGINDLVAKTSVKDLNNPAFDMDLINVYAVEKYPELRTQNRVTEKIATYQLNRQGKVVSGDVMTYSDYDGVWRVHENWAYTPRNQKDDSFSFNWKSPELSTSWTKKKSISNYYNGEANEIVDQIGVKSSVVYKNGKQTFPIASVNNAGLDEILVLPGDDCGVDNWTECYNTPIMRGRSLGKDFPETNGAYGRFSNVAVLINKQKKLSGKIINVKKPIYRFSAWVQGTSSIAGADEIKVQLNSKNPIVIGLKGHGLWEYVEKDVEMDLDLNVESVLNVFTSNDTEIHLQDVRFVPEDAQVEVTFWDKHLNKPIAKVDDRGVGAYFEYDEAGRVVEIYGETADGTIALKSKNSYYSSVCAVKSDKNNALKELVVNGELLAVSQVPGVIEIAVKNNTDELKISWSSYIDGENVFYSLHKTGDPSSFEKEDCTGSCTIEKKFEGMSMTLDIAVSSMEHPYTIIINKTTSGWIDYGTPLTEGFNPVYLTDNDISGVRYLDKNGIRKAVYKNTGWSEYEFNREMGDFVSIGGSVNNGVDYVFALPNFTGKLSRSEKYTSNQNALGYKNISSGENYLLWFNMGAYDKDGVKSDMYRMSTSINNETYVLYDRLEYVENPEELGKEKSYSEYNSLYVKKLDGDSWKELGSVENISVKDADIVTGTAFEQNGVPFVAYIGKNPGYSIQTTCVYDTLLDPNDLNEPFEKPEGSNFKKQIVDEHPIVVVVKYYNVNEKKWKGFGSDFGDILFYNGEHLPNAKKVKLASDGMNIYMAILYNDAFSAQHALKVYKLVVYNSELQFNELVDQSFGSAIIAYLEENNHFDLVVHNNVPYVSFVNSANKDNITVVKYDNGVWRSVGTPAFANVSNKKNSADLAVNPNGVPYVVLRESIKSTNTMRKNKIVPMKYSAKDDKDLTIAALGDIPETSISKNFRQYILNYDAVVPMTMESVPFDIMFSKKDDVKGFFVENDGVPVFSWKKSLRDKFMMYAEKNGDEIPKFEVPLKNGSNEIKIHIYNSAKNMSLTYSFNIYREYASEFEFNSSTLGVADGVLVLKESDYVAVSSSSYAMSSDNNSGNEFNPPSSEKKKTVTSVEKFEYEIYPPKDGTTSKTICPKPNSAWYMLIDGLLQSKPECFEFDVEQNQIIVSSSSSLNDSKSSSSTRGNQIVFIDKDGNKKVIDIVVIRSSSSLSSLGSSSSLRSSSSLSLSSSSSSSSYSSSSNSSSSEYIEGTAIPKDYTPQYRYKFVAESNISFENKVSVASGEYMANDVNVAANAQIQGNVLCSSDMSLNSYAYVYSITLGGTLNSQAGASYGSMEQQSVVVPYVSRMNFNVGSESINVWAGQTMILSPGDYGDVAIYTNASVYFEPGVYRFNSLYIAPHVEVKSTAENALLQIWVQNNMRIDDNSSFMVDKNPKQVFVYGNGFFDMYIGVRTKISATIVYPNGRVNISPYTEYSGLIWANSINIGANTTIK